MAAQCDGFRSSYSSVHLDLIRGLAAFAVLFGHLRALFFVDFRELEAPGLLVHVFYLFAGFGHQAVMVFFVLSGFLISSSVIQNCSMNRWSWRGYLINRVSRLHIVLIPGLCWTMGLDLLGMSLFPDHPLYHGVLASNVLPPDVGTRLGWGTFIGNIACLQNIVVTPLGSNSALWSLSNEFWYYAIFPLLAVPLWRRGGYVGALVSVGSGVLLLFFVGPDHAFYFVIWLLGTGLALYNIRRPCRRASWLGLIGSLLMLTAALLAVRFRVLRDLWMSDLLVGGAFALVTLALLQWHWPCSWSLYRRFATGLAGFSYSLYVFHLPILVFLAACILRNARWQPSTLHLSLGVSLLVMVTIVGFLLSQLTEAYTERLRRFLMCLLMPVEKRGQSRGANSRVPRTTNRRQEAPALEK